MGIKTYDPGQVIVSFGGADIKGFAEGSFVTVAYDEDAFKKMTGGSGETCRIRSQKKGGSITLRLMQSSSSNDRLSAIANLDRRNGSGVSALQVKDLSGTSLYSAANAWIKKIADSGFGDELGDREWVLDCDELDANVGGNNTEGAV